MKSRRRRQADLKGGAAKKVAVLSSALFGSISGSAYGECRLHRRDHPARNGLSLAYPNGLAAAVEAVASSGGRSCRPCMGAGAFVHVEHRLPYTGIMAAAGLTGACVFRGGLGGHQTPMPGAFRSKGVLPRRIARPCGT